MDLTVAICMYNAEKYIVETLKCLSQQTRQDFYLLIINDCSTDTSVALVEDYFKLNPRQYELINMSVNQGLCAGRRYVEDNASTKYLLFVDADDRPLPEYVEKLYTTITSDSHLMAVGCYLEYINIFGERVPGGIFLGEKDKTSFFDKAKKEKLIFMASTSIYNRELALAAGGHNTIGFPKGKPRYQDLCEDLDLWTRMSDFYKDGYAIIVIPEILYQYRKGDGMSTSSLGMILRMRHIKTNLKRRRRGERELTFIEFRDQMSVDELRKIEKEAKSADMLRNGYYSLRKGKLLSGTMQILSSAMTNPRYFWSKVKHNLMRIK